MEPLIYLLLVLALVGDVLLAAVLVLTLRRNREEGDDGQLARTLQKVIESETDLLADQLRTTQAETARALNIPQGTAATRQRRALQLLRLELGEEGDA